MYQSDGSLLACSIRDYSSGGLSLTLPTALAFVRNTRLTVAIASGGREYAFPVQVVFSHANKLSLQLDGLYLQQQIDWVHCTFARADALPMTPGERFTLNFDLLPTSVRIRAGHRLALCLVDRDTTHFDDYAGDGAPTPVLRTGGNAGSYIDFLEY